MPRVGDMFPSKWLKASDFDDGEQTLTIRDIGKERFGQGRDAEDKFVLYFEGEDKGLVLNQVNVKTIAKLHGDDTDDWEGKLVTLFATEVQFGADMVPAIRIRSKMPKRTAEKGTVRKPVPVATDDDEVDAPF